jgi:signal transduction histidine kinase
VEVIEGPGREIKVRDHGAGIPVELQETVFERFWRADRQRSGAGLGLAITRKIMEACGGRVQIDDARDGGALVSLWFPNPSSLHGRGADGAGVDFAHLSKVPEGAGLVRLGERADLP